MSGSIESYLKKLEKSPEFQKFAKSNYANYAKSTGYVMPEVNIIAAQQRLADILHDELSKVVGKYSGETFLDKVSTGSVMISTDFATATVLVDAAYGYSLVDNTQVNLTHLFNTGYSASRQVDGYYSKYGCYIYSLQSRAGLHFIENAISRFNSEYAGLGVTLTYSAGN